VISQTAEYALRAVACLAQAQGLLTVDAIAATARLPVGYLAKIMLTLSRAGIVASQRGIHGGFSLRIPADRLTVYEVVQAIDPIERIRACPLGIDGHGSDLCALHRAIDGVAGGVEAMFRAMTIASISGPGLCCCPRPATDEALADADIRLPGPPPP
jgi:Rrf2 family protein